MRASAALILLVLLPGPAAAMGAGILEGVHEVTVRPEGSPATVEAGPRGGRTVYVDSHAAGPAADVPVVAAYVVGRAAPYASSDGSFVVSWGREGRLETHDPATWAADAEVTAPTLDGALAPLGGAHLAARARGERLAEAKETRLERAFAGAAPLERAPMSLGDARLARLASPAERPLEYHAPAPFVGSHGPTARAAPTPATPTMAAAASATNGPPSPWTDAARFAAGAAVLVLIPWALYHRLRGERVLDQDTRSRLHALLRDSPGISTAEAARALGVDPTTARYHLARLVRERLAVTEGPARSVRYFAAGSVPPELRAAHVAAREGHEVLAAVRAAPGATKSALAAALAIARPTLAWHLARLERAGLVRCERAGREARVFPHEQALAALTEARPRRSLPEAF